MLWVLLDNAIKYTPESGRVDVSLRKDNGAPTIEVADTGIGISESDLPRIFDRSIVPTLREARLKATVSA